MAWDSKFLRKWVKNFFNTTCRCTEIPLAVHCDLRFVTLPESFGQSELMTKCAENQRQLSRKFSTVGKTNCVRIPCNPQASDLGLKKTVSSGRRFGLCDTLFATGFPWYFFRFVAPKIFQQHEARFCGLCASLCFYVSILVTGY